MAKKHRADGYYWVLENGEYCVALWDGYAWTMPGSEERWSDHKFKKELGRQELEEIGPIAPPRKT